MRCPSCGSENADSAKFCKKCGTPLEKKTINHENMINSINESSSSDNTAKYIIAVLVVVAVVLAGTFVYLYGFNQDSNVESDNQIDNSDNENESVEEPAKATQVSSSAKSSSMSILGGSFSTGGGLEDKTYASINVGSQHAGENVEIQIFYSRDGNTLNNGNMVPKTVDSEGYIEVSSADSYKYFPDFAEINIYDSSGSNLLATKSVSLNPESGTQSF